MKIPTCLMQPPVIRLQAQPELSLLQGLFFPGQHGVCWMAPRGLSLTQHESPDFRGPAASAEDMRRGRDCAAPKNEYLCLKGPTQLPTNPSGSG